MNQILDYSTGNNNSGKHRGGGAPTDKIAKVLAIMLLIFAIFLIFSGVTSWLKNNKTTESTGKTNTKIYQAVIETELDEENQKVKIIVDNEIEISKVIYNWNSKKESTIAGDGTNHIEKTIELSAGESTLTVKVIDIKNNETKKSFSFNSEVGRDIENPTITLDYQGGNLIITAQDETELSYITYRWNDEPETTVEVAEDADDKTTLTETIDILMGENTIIVTAVDTSNNVATSTKPLVGVTKPHIDVNAIGDGGILEITCTHESGIKEIYYTLNGRPYQATEDVLQGSAEVKFTQALDEGYNRIILKVTSVDDVVAEFDGQCEYYPNGRPEEDTSADTENSGNETESDSENETTEDSEETDGGEENTTNE